MGTQKEFEFLVESSILRLKNDSLSSNTPKTQWLDSKLIKDESTTQI